MFGINKGCEASLFLAFCDGVDGQGGFTGGFGAIDFNNASLRKTTDADGQVKGYGTRRDGFHFDDLFVAKFHNGALTIRFFQAIYCELEGF